MTKSKSLYFFVGLIVLVLPCLTKIFKPGTTIEIECPNALLKQFTSMRTYALVLTNAQKSMQIKIYIIKSSKSINNQQQNHNTHQKLNQQQNQAINTKKSQFANSTDKLLLTEQTKPQNQDNSQLQLIPECRLNKDNKICVLDSFISQLNIKCNNNGSISLLIVEPAVITAEQQGDTNAPVINQKVISPVLQQNVKGVLIFKPSSTNIINPNIVNYQQEYKQIFISNCIQSISYFQHRFLLGIIGRSYIEIVMVNQGIVGEWIFYQISNVITHTQDSLRSYSLANQITNFYIQEDQLNNLGSYNYHGFKVLLCSQNITQIEDMSINVTVLLKIQQQLIGQEQVNQTIHIKQGSLIGKIPIRIAFFYSEHPIKSINLSFSKSMHYILQLSQSRLASVSGLAQRPTIEEDQFLFYSFENRKSNTFEVQARVIGQYRTKITPALRIMSSGIDKISGIILPTMHTIHDNQTQNNSSEVVQQISQQAVQIQNNKIFPIKVTDGGMQALFLLFITPQRSLQYDSTTVPNKQHAVSMQHFKLMLQTSYIPVSVQIGQQMQQLLSQSQIKRYTISYDKLQKILPKTKHLKITCTGCHAFATYNPQCSSINCCEYAHVNQIDIKPMTLMIIVLAVTGHSNGVGLIKLKVMEDNGGFVLQDGKIVQGLLWNTDMYLYQTDGKYDIQIVINSQMQSILLLASTTKSQFPTKLTFDYQSNEGYIKIPALKSAKTIYIRLLKMTTSFSEYSAQSQLNYKVPYQIVMINNEETGAKIQIIQGKPFNYVMSKGSKKQYKFNHFCNSIEKNSQIEERLYLRVDPKNHYNIGGKNLATRVITLKIQFMDINTSKILHTRYISQQDVIEVTNFMSRSSITLKNSSSLGSGLSIANLCSVTAVITNQVAETLSLSVMFFKQKQMYQIYPGHFTRDRILTNGHQLMVYCVINPNKQSNIYVYSMKQQIKITAKVILVKEIKEIPMVYEAQIDDQQRQFAEGETKASNFTYKTLLLEEIKFYSYSHHVYFPVLSSLIDKNSSLDFQQCIAIVLLKIRTSVDTISSSSFRQSLDNIFAICTQNQSILQVGSRLQYKLQNQNTHNFYYPITQELVSNQKLRQSKLTGTQKQIILQTIKLDGNFRVKANLKYLGQSIGEFNLQKKEAIKDLTIASQQKVMQYSSQAIVIIKTEQIRSKLTDYLKKQIELGKKITLQQLQYNNLFIEFQLSCYKLKGSSDSGKKYCQFLTTLQTSQSDIRELSAGIPEVFHINKHSSIIFIYDNAHDNQFKFKVNRKSGFPNYKLCSYRQTAVLPIKSQSNLQHKNDLTSYNQPILIDKCLSDLQNQQNYLNLRIQQNAFNNDQNLIIGRTHELIINQFSEHYCTNCTYYLALYSDYDIVQGSIFIMVSPTKQKQIINQETLEGKQGQDSATMIQQGSSITTIVYRGEPDRYAISDWESLMAVVYQLQGNVDVQVYCFHSTTKKKIILMNNAQFRDSTSKTLKNTITINLQNTSFHKDPSTSQQNNTTTLQTDPNIAGNGGKFFISISPSHNMPSSLYTLVIMNKYQQIINIKDGVPYQMRYQIADTNQDGRGLNPNVKFRYTCENQGVIMISTKDFQELDVRLTCQDQTNAISSTNLTQQQKQGTPIDISYLLNARKSYKLSNRLDITISPKTCTKYQLSITSKLQTVSYSIMVSSTDIITLPLNKQMPGLLKYQTKLYQIYQISVQEKIDARVIFKFCQGGNGRIMIAKSKKNVYQQIYQEEIEIYQQSTFETIKYKAKPGLFYIKIQFKARDGVLQYTIYVQNSNIHQSTYKSSSNPSASVSPLGYSPISIYNNMNTITYKVKHIKYDSTEYQIQFYPIIQEGSVYQIQYYILESTKLQLLKKTENCNGQYFVQLVSHHQQIKETKVNVKHKQIQNNKDNIQTVTKSQQQQQQQKQKQKQQQQQSPVISFSYISQLHSSYITIIPMVYNRETHQFYHLYVPKYHQIQLTNGQIFSKISYILSQIADKIQQVVDIHGSQYVILAVLAIMCCGCLFAVLAVGVIIGGRYFFRVKTVYVMKEGKPQESQQLREVRDEQLNNNSSGLVTSSMNLMREQHSQQNEQQLQNSQINNENMEINMQHRNQSELIFESNNNKNVQLQKQITQQKQKNVEQKQKIQEFINTEVQPKN